MFYPITLTIIVVMVYSRNNRHNAPFTVLYCTALHNITFNMASLLIQYIFSETSSYDTTGI